MKMLRRLTMERLTVVILFMLVFAMAVRVPLDTDTWWHIRSGEYIVTERTIPTTDPFSHTRGGARWIDHGWASQVVMYGFYEVFGGSVRPGDPGNIGLALYTAGLATLGMVLVYRMCEGNAYVRAFVVVIGAAAAAIFWSPRPQMFSFVFGALTLYLLHLYKRERLDRLWFVPLLMVAWVNLHGGFAIGFIFLLGSIAGEVLGNLFDATNPQVVRWARLRKMVIVTLVAILAVALNPHGVTMIGYPFRTVGIGALQEFIQEWASPNFHNPGTWPFVMLLLGVLALAGVGHRQMDWTDLVLVCGTAFMALMAGRNIAVFAIAATPVLTRHLNAWLTERGWQIRPVTRVRGPMVWINWLLLVVVLAGALGKIAAALSEKTVREAQEMYLPVELAAYLESAMLPGKLFNSYNWGGYLVFAAPSVPVYVDGRTDLYDDAFLRAYLDIVSIRAGWAEALAAQQIGVIAIESNSPLAALLRERPETWTEQVFDDGQSALFVLNAGGVSDE